jgi:hypothetical protein
MNSLYEDHEGSIRWHYRCFDRILLRTDGAEKARGKRRIDPFEKLQECHAACSGSPDIHCSRLVAHGDGDIKGQALG